MNDASRPLKAQRRMLLLPVEKILIRKDPVLSRSPELCRYFNGGLERVYSEISRESDPV